MPCGGLRGCWNTAEVNIGYFPYILNQDAHIKVGPSDHHDNVVSLHKGARFGVQSTRNPSVSNRPAHRPQKNGYVWGYSHSKGTSGWINKTALTPDTSGAVWASGPADADFQVGAQKAVNRSTSSCRGVAGTRVRTIDVIDTYLRYGPQSTPYFYVVKGDRVKEKWRGTGKYMCVEIVSSKTCPKGTRGWIPYASVA